jgi:hypothetical protein
MSHSGIILPVQECYKIKISLYRRYPQICKKSLVEDSLETAAHKLILKNNNSWRAVLFDHYSVLVMYSHISVHSVIFLRNLCCHSKNVMTDVHISIKF